MDSLTLRLTSCHTAMASFCCDEGDCCADSGVLTEAFGRDWSGPLELIYVTQPNLRSQHSLTDKTDTFGVDSLNKFTLITPAKTG